MQFEGARRSSSQAPNLTPLIDIVFLLLIFFLLTSNFIKEERIDIELPQASSSHEIDHHDNLLKIRLSADNTIYLQNKPVSLDHLDAALATSLQSSEYMKVQLRGDKGANLMHIVAILDAARKGGASGVDIVTEKP